MSSSRSAERSGDADAAGSGGALGALGGVEDVDDPGRWGVHAQRLRGPVRIGSGLTPDGAAEVRCSVHSRP